MIMTSKNSKILGVITARGGSKGIPGKNIKPLCGKPLIAYTIGAAKSSGVFDKIIISTDDPAIAEVASAYGCEVPFLRPKELAEDKTPHLPVMQHAVEWLKKHENYEPDYVMILQPTSPLRQAIHIKEAADLILKSKADSVLGVSEMPSHYHPMWALNMNEGGMLTLFHNGDHVRNRVKQRQLLPTTYIHNSCIYLFKTGLLFDKENPSFYGEKVAAYVMDPKYSVNIDEPSDWEEAEKALKAITNNQLPI